MPAGSEQIQRSPVFEQHGFLGLVDNELGPCSQFVVREFPSELVGVAFKLDDINQSNGRIPRFEICRN
jgi:hypothetical protein